MQEPSIFTRIIRGEIPSYKVHEDKKTLVFLDIDPVQAGHMLVVPKKQIDRLEELDPADYDAIMATVKEAMRRVTEVFGGEYRACLKIEGFDVPHAHVHVIPCKTVADFWNRQRRGGEPDHEALTNMAARLRW